MMAPNQRFSQGLHKPLHVEMVWPCFKVFWFSKDDPLQRQKKRWEDNIKVWTGMDFASSTS